jgi:hypothetical protein
MQRTQPRITLHLKAPDQLQAKLGTFRIRISCRTLY